MKTTIENLTKNYVERHPEGNSYYEEKISKAYETGAKDVLDYLAKRFENIMPPFHIRKLKELIQELNTKG